MAPVKPLAVQVIDRTTAQPVVPKSIRVYKQAWFLAFALALVTAAIYSPVLRHPFVNFDDQAYIVENSHVIPGCRSQRCAGL